MMGAAVVPADPIPDAMAVALSFSIPVACLIIPTVGGRHDPIFDRAAPLGH